MIRFVRMEKFSTIFSIRFSLFLGGQHNKYDIEQNLFGFGKICKRKRIKKKNMKNWRVEKIDSWCANFPTSVMHFLSCYFYAKLFCCFVFMKRFRVFRARKICKCCESIGFFVDCSTSFPTYSMHSFIIIRCAANYPKVIQFIFTSITLSLFFRCCLKRFMG